MRIGIVCAGDSEVAPFLSMLNEASVTEKSLLKFYEGKIENMDVVTLFSGVCKVNAAIAVQILIDIYKCDIIINAGTAGGIDERLKILDTVVSTEVAYHDVNEDVLTDFHPWMSSVYFKADEQLVVLAEKIANKLKSNHKIFFGRMVTGEKFIEDEEREQIKVIYEPLSVDMESAAVAHVCYVNKVPFIIVRTITDMANHSSVDNFEWNCKEASQLCADFVKMMLREL